MVRFLDRMRHGRVGLAGIVLLVLLVLVVAHALVMGGGHSDEMVCGSCVVVIATGLAAVVALRPHRSAPEPATATTWFTPFAVLVSRPFRPPSLRSAVLRL